MVSTQLKNSSQIGSFPPRRGEHKKHLKPPPSEYMTMLVYLESVWMYVLGWRVVWQKIRSKLLVPLGNRVGITWSWNKWWKHLTLPQTNIAMGKWTLLRCSSYWECGYSVAMLIYWRVLHRTLTNRIRCMVLPNNDCFQYHSLQNIAVRVPVLSYHVKVQTASMEPGK